MISSEHTTDVARTVDPDNPAALTPLQRDIIRTLSYFDVFGHPLKAEEIYRFLPSNSVTPADVADACFAPPLSFLLAHHLGYYSIASQAERGGVAIVEERRSRERRALPLLRIARFMGRVVFAFPYVRGVFISGELSKGVATENGDIDFVVVTRSGRLWTARTLLIAFKKVFLLNSKRFLCLNHMVSEHALEETNRNRYTATEIGTLAPLYSDDLFARYLRYNSWISAFLPNILPVRTGTGSTAPGTGTLKRVAEWLLNGSIGDRLERGLLSFWRGVWKKRYPDLSPEERASLFRCEPDLSTAYVGNFQPRILCAYEERLRRFHLEAADSHG